MAKRRGIEQPIWILVALILAVVVGGILLSMLGKLKMPWTQENQANKMTMLSFCSGWINPESVDASGNINPRASEPIPRTIEEKTDIFRAEGWLSNQKNGLAYVEPGPISGCDCVVYLASTAGDSRLGPTAARLFLIDESATGSLYDPAACHKKAVTVGKTIPELADLFP
jgi:hypothetical protein